jgi:hypothetical protein
MHPAVVITTVLGGLFAVAIIGELVSTKGQFPTVLTSGGTALSQVIQAAVSPVTGNTGNTLTSTQSTP